MNATTYRLVDHLARLADREGSMALRRGWTNAISLYPIVSPYLPIPLTRRAEETSLLIARLFGVYPELGQTQLPAALARASANGRRSVEVRMAGILNSAFDELPRHLRVAVLAAKSERVPIDWHQLMDDLLRWGSRDRYIERRWARIYWGSNAAAPVEVVPEADEDDDSDEDAPDSEEAETDE